MHIHVCGACKAPEAPAAFKERWRKCFPVDRGGWLGMLPRGTDGFGQSVSHVVPGGPAERAGVLRGDRFLSIDGVATPTAARLSRQARSLPPGTATTLVVERADAKLELRITVAGLAKDVLLPVAWMDDVKAVRGFAFNGASTGAAVAFPAGVGTYGLPTLANGAVLRWGPRESLRSAPTALAFHGDTLACGEVGGLITTWEAKFDPHHELWSLKGLRSFDVRGHVVDVAFSPDGGRLAIATRSAYGTLDLERFELALVQVESGGQLQPAFSAGFCPEGRWLTSCNGGGVEVKDLRTQEQVTLEGSPRSPRGVAFSWDRRHLAVTTAEGALLYEAQGETFVQSGKLPANHQPRAVAYLPRPARPSQLLVAHGKRIELRLEDRTIQLVGHASDVEAVAVSPDGKHAMSSSAAGELFLWALPAAPAVAPRTGTVTASTLNVRSGPGTSHAIVGARSQDDVVTILEERDDWVRVTWSGAPAGELWVSRAYLRF